jgi:ribosomal protein S18 acetylase RimI-like enzyme
VSGFLADAGVIETPRLRLEIATLAHFEDCAAWIEAALKPEWTLSDLAGWLDSGNTVAVLDRDGALAGLAAVALHRPVYGAAVIPFLAIQPERRYRGLGGEAALAIERRLRRNGYDSVFACVPDTRGLAVYFWLRLGFRPLLRADAPWPLMSLGEVAPAGIWMLRDRD